MMIGKGELFLVPTAISENTSDKVIPTQVKDELKNIRYFFAEDVRTARRYLSSLKVFESIEILIFEVLDKHTQEENLPKMFEPLFNGNNIGVLSDSGCPGVADPGSLAVKYAHEHGIKVRPLVGPSSILLALMASGLNGQCFAFLGYLPIEKQQISKMIKDLENESSLKGQTQIFIETPYRNNSVMKNLLMNLRDDTLLCRAVDLTGSSEDVKTLPVKTWRTIKEELPKLPAIFLLSAARRGNKN